MPNNNLRTPIDVLNFFNLEADPLIVHQFLSQLKEENYAKSKYLDLTRSADVICQALTSRDITDSQIKTSKLQDALISPTDVIQIIQLIIQAIQTLISYIESSGLCKTNLCKSKTTLARKQVFIDKLKALDGNNPFINLAGITLINTDFSHANFRFVDFSHAKLSNINLTGANLQYANLCGAKLVNVNLTDADVTGADLRWLDLSATGVKINSPVSLKSFLQTNYPKEVCLESIPTALDLEAALNEIRLEIEGEKHMKLLTDNILKVADMIKIPANGVAFMEAARLHAIYTNHLASKIMKKVDTVVTKAHNKFFKDNDPCTLGTPNELKLINKEKEFIGQLKTIAFRVT